MTIHPSFSDWYRSAAISPPEGLLQHRWKAIEEIAKNATTDFILGLLRLFALPRATEVVAPEGFRDAFLAQDETFPSKGNLQELRVLAGATLRKLIDEGGPGSNIAALGLLCASFSTRLASIPEKDHVDAAERYLLTRARSDRSRRMPKEIELPTFSRAHYDALLPSSQFAAPGNLPNIHDPLGNLLVEVTTAISSALKQAQEAIVTLSHLSQVQAEELNILWWLQTAFSRHLQKPFTEISYRAGALVFPVELADLTIFVPGSEASTAVLLHALRCSGLESSSQAITLLEAINATPRPWRESMVARHNLNSLGSLCPILLAIHKSLDTEGPNEWLPVYRKACDVSAEAPVQVPHLTLQLYRECLLLRMLPEAEQ